jgi:predicted signal transduction protein with EAL and GGDEF domain
VLARLAAMLQEEAPDGAYRLSADEFALLLPGVCLEQAFLRMEALRARVQASAKHFGLPENEEVTACIGVAQYPRDAKEAEGLLRAAEAALSVAKEAGPNRVGLPLNEEMVMKSCYYPASNVRRLKSLAEQSKRKESVLLREALSDLLRKYDTPREN